MAARKYGSDYEYAPTFEDFLRNNPMAKTATAGAETIPILRGGKTYDVPVCISRTLLLSALDPLNTT